MDKYSQFICANTQEMSLQEIEQEHITPVHVKDNESVISHPQFIRSVMNVASSFYGQSTVPSIRVSHPIKGRIPEARNKPAKELLPSETTIYYERMAWVVHFPEIQAKVGDEVLDLTVGGVKAYNLDNLYSTKDTLEQFKVFVGFKNQVCTNLCVSTDGYLSDLKTNNLDHLQEKVLLMLSEFSIEQQEDSFNKMFDIEMNESQFAQMLGKVKLFNTMPRKLRKDLPEIGLSDSQLSTVAEDYYSDKSHCNQDGKISIWNMYNLFTGANKSSYIDTFLDRNVKVYQGATHLQKGLSGHEPSWYLH